MEGVIYESNQIVVAIYVASTKVQMNARMILISMSKPCAMFIIPIFVWSPGQARTESA